MADFERARTLLARRSAAPVIADALVLHGLGEASAQLADSDEDRRRALRYFEQSRAPYERLDVPSARREAATIARFMAEWKLDTGDAESPG